MNSLQPKKDDILRHPLNEQSVDGVVRLLLQGRELRLAARTGSRGTVIDRQSLNHSSAKSRIAMIDSSTWVG
jgi:hypothetical protein